MLSVVLVPCPCFRKTLWCTLLEKVLAADLLQMPFSFQLAQACTHNFFSVDRGTVSGHNDGTFDSQATFFAIWCTEFSLFQPQMTPACILALAVSMQDVQMGNNLVDRDDLHGDLISGYVWVAHPSIPSHADFPSAPRGKPVAFLLLDFVFDDLNHQKVPHSAVWLSFQHKKKLRLLEILWCYDKSPSNFSTQTYFAMHHAIFCPIVAATHIVHRSLLLHIPSDKLIGVLMVFSTVLSRTKTFVTFVMLCSSVLAAHSDSYHFRRQNITQGRGDGLVMTILHSGYAGI